MPQLFQQRDHLNGPKGLFANRTGSDALLALTAVEAVGAAVAHTERGTLTTVIANTVIGVATGIIADGLCAGTRHGYANKEERTECHRRK